MTRRVSWDIVSRLADLIQIATVVVGVVGIVLYALGLAVSPNLANQVVLVAAVGFGVIGVASVVSAVARNRSEVIAFTEGRTATSRLLLIVGFTLMGITIALVLFLALGPQVVVGTDICRT